MGYLFGFKWVICVVDLNGEAENLRTQINLGLSGNINLGYLFGFPATQIYLAEKIGFGEQGFLLYGHGSGGHGGF